LCVLGTLLLLAANVNAQVTSGSFTVSPFAGYAFHSHDSRVDDDSIFGASFGYDLTENFGLEASYATMDTVLNKPDIVEYGPDPDGPGPAQGEATLIEAGGPRSMDYELYRIEGLFYVYPGKKIAPYATIGYGSYKYTYEDVTVKHSNIPLGVGVKYFVTENIALRADLKALYKLPDNPMLVTFGMTYQFGGE
jgi:OOP family OmpA-OmpF porin